MTPSPAPPRLSPANRLVADARRLLRQRRARADAGRHVIEGPRLIVEALDAGVDLDAVVVRADVPDDAVSAVLSRAVGRDIAVYSLDASTFDSVASTTTPQPALAIAVTPVHDVAAACAASLVLVLVGVADPGNAGTLLRAADAVGGAAVVFAGGSVDPYNPKTVRSAAGAAARVPIVVAPDVVDVLASLGEAGCTTVAAVPGGGADLDDVDLGARPAIVLGSEAHGLPAAVIDACSGAVSIPMAGRAESLNVAMAGTVLAFEVARRRRTVVSDTTVSDTNDPRDR